jgi:phage terminase large subunit
VMPYTMTFGDCNPGPKQHWIRERAKVGSLKLVQTTHKDNPTLFDPATGKITEQGKRTMARLERLTGMRRERLLLGHWATAEGAVYDMFDRAIHVQERDEREMRIWYLAIDEGYTNPAVILLVGEDSDGRQHIHREWYKRGQLQSTVVSAAKEKYLEYNCRMAAVDDAAAGLIAEMRNSGMNAQGAKGRVQDRIYSVQNRLKVLGDGKPRLTIDPSCENTINDFESRVWKPEKDEPVKENDHGTDAYEYLDLLTGINLELPKGQPQQQSKWLEPDQENMGWAKRY